jgi:hypothetical protein
MVNLEFFSIFVALTKEGKVSEQFPLRIIRVGEKGREKKAAANNVEKSL